MSSQITISIEELYGLLLDDPETVTRFNDWLDSEGFERTDTEPHYEYTPHEHNESCGLLCATIQAYIEQMTLDLFATKPLLWRLHEPA